MITIELGHIGCEEQAKKIKEKLEGKTYYNFQVEYCSYMGNWPVSVCTDYEGTTVEEVTSMLLFALACEL